MENIEYTDKTKYLEIKKYADDMYSKDDFDISFIKLCLKIFFPECLNDSDINLNEAIEGLGSNDCGIDAFLVDEKQKVMHFFQFKTTQNWNKETISPKDAEYFFGMKARLETTKNHSNSKVQDIIDQYNNAVKYNKNHNENKYSFKFHFFTSYNLSNTNSLNRDYDKDLFLFYDLDDVFEKLKEYESGVSEEPDECFIEFYNQLGDKNIQIWDLKIDNMTKKTSIGIVTGWSLINLYHKNMKALFHRNVRNFLGNKGINKKIIKTAESKPKNFYFYNNGITITCDKYDKVGSCLKLKRPQVINGAQTISSIYQAYENLRKDKTNSESSLRAHFESLLVMTRIIQSTIRDDTNFSREITEYNNTQNKILAQDFFANDSTQNVIYKKLLEFGYFYEHKRGMFNEEYKKNKEVLKEIKDKDKIIEIGDLTMIYNTFKNCDSSTTSKKSKLFEKNNFNDIFDKDCTTDKGIKKMIIAFNLYKILKDVGKQMEYLKKKNEKTIKTTSEFTINIRDILTEAYIELLQNGKFEGLSEEQCKNKIDELEALKYPFSIISIIGYILKEIEKDLNKDISQYYNDRMFYEKIQKKLFQKISKTIKENFRKNNELGNIIHYFKTEKVEKDFETYIIDNKFDNNVSISELYGIDF